MTVEDEATAETRGPSSMRTPVLASRYELRALIGSGGNGNVYRAYDRELDEIVALKLLRSGGSRGLARLRQEVKLARRVTHPNVVRTFDIGQHEGVGLIAMELVEGESLSARLRRVGALHHDHTCAIGVGLARGLGAAHAKNVIHRDLKPANILLAEEPPPAGVKIADFGIASIDSAEGAEIVGTPCYMAPEQLTRTSSALDPRTDLYALGLVIFEMLSGQRAFGEHSFEEAQAALPRRTSLDLRAFVPDCDPRLVKLVADLTAIDPKLRPVDVEAIATTLEKIWLDAPLSKAIATPRMVRGKRIAVLPLATSDVDLGDGLTDDLIDALSRLPSLEVCSRGQIEEKRRSTADPIEIGLALGACVVVHGDVARDEAHVTATVRMVSVLDGLQLWSERYRRPSGQVLSLPQAIARDAASFFDEKEEIENTIATIDAEGARLYLEGRGLLQRRSFEGNVRAVAVLERALALAPDEPRILSTYAHAVTQRFVFMWMGDSDREIACRAAEKALTLAPTLPHPWHAMSFLHWATGEPAKAITSAVQARRLARSSGETSFLVGELLVPTGDPRALHLLQHALDLDSRLWTCRLLLATRLALVGEWERADVLFGAPPVDPERLNHHWSLRLMSLTWTRDIDRIERARREVSQGEFAIRAWADSFFRKIDGHLDDVAERTFLTMATQSERAKRRRWFFSQLRADLLAYFGHTAEALSAVEMAVDGGLYDIVWMDQSPALEHVRALPAFAALRATVAERASAVVGAYDAALK